MLCDFSNMCNAVYVSTFIVLVINHLIHSVYDPANSFSKLYVDNALFVSCHATH